MLADFFGDGDAIEREKERHGLAVAKRSQNGAFGSWASRFDGGEGCVPLGMGELNLSAGIGALGGRGGEIEELREGGEDGLWSQVASGVEVVEFAILAAEIVAVRKVQGRSGEAEAGAQEADIGEVDFGIEEGGLGGGERDGEVAIRDFIETGQGFINERGFGIQVGEVGVRAHACGGL